MPDREEFGEFIYECGQLADEMDALLLQAEPVDRLAPDTLNELFRLAHTLKGSTAMMGYAALSENVHRVEDILQAAKSSSRPDELPWKKVIVCGLNFTAYLHGALDDLEAGKPLDEASATARLLSESQNGLHALLKDGKADNGSSQNAAEYAHRPENLAEYSCFRVFLRPCPLSALRGFLVYKKVSAACKACYTVPNELAQHPELDSRIDRQGFELGFIPQDGASVESICKLISAQPLVERVEALPAVQYTSAKKTAARVSVSQARVNRLIDAMDEILSAESALTQQLRSLQVTDPHTERLLHTLAHRSTALRGDLEELGMTEVGGLFLRMQRLARDLLNQSGKLAEVRLEGTELTVDKSVVESVSDMLLHVIRNAVDHGLELPEERVAAGKDARGLLCLSAKRQGGRMQITVSDDGRGICAEKVLNAARTRGLLTKPEKEYTRQELYDFLLLNGFTTKNEVTKNSGRGVGLDAVKHMVEKIGGRMSLSSEEEKGTAVVLDLPLSLTMTETLLIRLNGQPCFVAVRDVQRVLLSALAPDGADGAVCVNGKKYLPLLPSAGEMTVLFACDAGQFYLRCTGVGETGAFIVKPVPPALRDALREQNLYAGCVHDAFGAVYMLLDVEKAAHLR